MAFYIDNGSNFIYATTVQDLIFYSQPLTKIRVFHPRLFPRPRLLYLSIDLYSHWRLL